MEQITLESVNENVEILKKTVFAIQEHLEDSFLTPEEEADLDEALEEHKKGEVFSLEDLEKLRNAS